LRQPHPETTLPRLTTSPGSVRRAYRWSRRSGKECVGVSARSGRASREPPLLVRSTGAFVGASPTSATAST